MKEITDLSITLQQEPESIGFHSVAVPPVRLAPSYDAIQVMANEKRRYDEAKKRSKDAGRKPKHA